MFFLSHIRNCASMINDWPNKKTENLIPSIQFSVLLSPYLCFISFLYFDLYVLGDDAWIR